MSKSVNAATVLAIAVSAFLATPVLADDWRAVKLRGTVVALVEGEWVRLERGVVIPGDQPIRTLRSGRVTFVRGEETIDIGPNTQIQIVDRAGYDKYTTVKQYFGRVAVEAEVREVQHFAVQTPYLAAVVKGTRFVVVSGEEGATVEVERGSVAVEDTDDHSSVVVTAGQEVTATPDAVMQVSGRGELPVVVDASGKPLSARAAEVRNANADVRGNSASAPGRSGSAPGHNKDSFGNGNGPGKSGSAPGHNKGASGNNGNGHGNSGNNGHGSSGNSSSSSSNSGSSGGSSSGSPGGSNSGNGNGNSGNNGTGNN